MPLHPHLSPTSVDSIESLFSWNEAATLVRSQISTRLGLDPSQVDVQAAAIAKSGIGEPTDLLHRILTVHELGDLISDVDFVAWSNCEAISLYSAILPCGLPRSVDEETIEASGEQWRIHMYDPDPFPMLPHAHNLSNGHKPDLSNGKLYRRRKHTGSLPKKDLDEFRARVKRIVLPPLSI